MKGYWILGRHMLEILGKDGNFGMCEDKGKLNSDIGADEGGKMG